MEHNFNKKVAGKSFLWILYMLEALGLIIGVICTGIVSFSAGDNLEIYNNVALISILSALGVCIIESFFVFVLKQNTLVCNKREIRYNTFKDYKKEFNTYYVKDLDKVKIKQNMFFFIITSDEKNVIEKRHKKINKEGNEEITKRESIQILKIPKMFDVNLSNGL